MQYKGQCAAIGPEVVKKTIGRQTAADVGEFIRKHFVNAMRNGERLCIDMESTAPDFAEFESADTFTK